MPLGVFATSGHVLRHLLRGPTTLLAAGPLVLINPSPIHVNSRLRVLIPSFSITATSKLQGRMSSEEMIGDGPKPNVVFVLGAPGSGKGTQCALIVRDLDYVHLSAGDLLRLERDVKGSKNGELILEHMKNGTIVPVEITCSLLENAMKSSGKRNFLVDGFPRNQDNLQGWIKQMGHKTNLQFVLFLEAPEELCVQRILARAATSQVVRPDDNVDSLKKRFQTYINDTMPIINYYAAKGLVRKVDSIRSPEECHKDITNLLQHMEKPIDNEHSGSSL